MLEDSHIESLLNGDQLLTYSDEQLSFVNGLFIRLDLEDGFSEKHDYMLLGELSGVLRMAKSVSDAHGVVIPASLSKRLTVGYLSILPDDELGSMLMEAYERVLLAMKPLNSE